MGYVKSPVPVQIEGRGEVFMWHGVARTPQGAAEPFVTRCGEEVFEPAGTLAEAMTLVQWEDRFCGEFDLCECALSPEDREAAAAALRDSKGDVPPAEEVPIPASWRHVATWDTIRADESDAAIVPGSKVAGQVYEWLKGAYPEVGFAHRIDFYADRDTDGYYMRVLQFAVNAAGKRYAIDGNPAQMPAVFLAIRALP